MPIKRDKEGVIIEITLTDDEEEELDEEAAAKKKKEEEDAKTEVAPSKIVLSLYRKNIATGQKSQAIAFFTSLTFSTSLDFRFVLTFDKKFFPTNKFYHWMIFRCASIS